MKANLENALLLATWAHRGQTRKDGVTPYILHPLRVMHRLGKTATESQRIVAVLHDVLEDTDYTLADLNHMGYSQAVLQPLEQITREKQTQTYWEYINAFSLPDAMLVKWHDIRDNMEDSYGNGLSYDEMDSMRSKRWQPALRVIWNKLRMFPEIDKLLT